MKHRNTTLYLVVLLNSLILSGGIYVYVNSKQCCGQIKVKFWITPKIRLFITIKCPKFQEGKYSEKTSF